MHRQLLGFSALLLFPALTAGCAGLPSSGPSAAAVERKGREDPQLEGLKIIDVAADQMPPPEAAELADTSQLEALAKPGRVDLLGRGDVLQVNIYEVGVTLFGSTAIIGSGGGGGGSNFASSARDQMIQGVTIDDAGFITLPYIGRIEAAGHTADDVRRAIIASLRRKSQEPQALVTVKENVTNTITLSGLVSSPGRHGLSLARERIQDVIAAGGGVRNPATPDNAILRFSRAGHSTDVYLSQIRAGSAADLQLLPGDRLEILQRDRSFTVFGATSRVSEINFEKARLTLSDAVARAGGPNSDEADPTGIFVFRFEKDPTMPSGERPIIYRLDMTKPASYFLSQRFVMRDKDVMYIANARWNQIRKFIDILHTIALPYLQIRTLTR